MLSSASDKAKLFAENFSKNFNLDGSGISLAVFPSRTTFKLNNISVTPMMVKKVIMNLGLSKASGPDCIPVVVLKKCEPELSYILAELFNKCPKESCFPDCWKVLSVVPVFKNVGERSTAKNYRPVSLLSVVSKVFEKLINNTLFLLYINDLLDDVICDIAIYGDDSTLYSKCDQASNLCQQLEFASKLESDLRDTVDWSK